MTMIQEEIIRQMTMIQEEKDVKSGPQKLGEGALVLFVCEINFGSKSLASASKNIVLHDINNSINSNDSKIS